MTKPLTYRDAGVDIDAGDELVERIKPLVETTRRAEVLAGLGAPVPNPAPPEVREWQTQWESFDRPMVPMLQLADGALSRGLGALARLAGLVGG